MTISHRLIGDLNVKVLDKHTAPAEGGPLLQILHNLNITPDGAVLYEFTLAASGTQDIDLNGVLLQSDGTTMDLISCGGIIMAVDDTGGDVSLTSKAANGVAGFSTGPSEGILVYPNGINVWVCPEEIAITAGTADLLVATEIGGALGATCQVLIWGSTS